MSPLRIEAYNPELSRWVEINEVGPKDHPGTISNNQPNGVREIYRFFCAEDDSCSAIQKLPLGIDVEMGNIRLLDRWSVTGATTIKVLRKGDPPFKMTVKTDKSPEPRKIRFTHK